MELQIDKFTPQKAELQTLAAQYSALTIAGIQDKAGYKIVDEARKDLKRKRVEITKTGKELREEAVAFQKKVIAVEKELVALIEPVELDLATKQEAIDKAIQMEKRRESLPYRQEQLKELGVVVADEFLLIMEDAAYLAFVTEKKAEKVAEQERQLKEQQEALAKAQAKLEEDKRLEAAKIEAAAQAAVQAAAKAEQDKLAAVEAERKKAADERAALVAEQEQKERDRQAAVEAEAKAKKEAEEQAKAEKAKLEAQKKYQAWLSSNDYVEDGSCLLRQEGTEMVLYRKVATYKL